MFHQITDRCLNKTWTEAQIGHLIGPYRRLQHVYAKAPDVRTNAAQGGTNSALLATRLKAGEITGALVCNSRIASSKVGDHFATTTNNHKILNAQGSKEVIIRAEAGEHCWRIAHQSDTMANSLFELTDLLDGQASVATYHDHVSAWSRVVLLLGYKISDKLKCKVNWHEW
jgi:coenzyme F420-reducing hydrogenase beta subunit